MEIKIDTSKDDVEHIKHMITFLQNFVNKTSPGVTGSESAPVGGMLGMFGEQSPITPQETQTPAPSEGIFGMFGQEETPSMQNTDSSSSANDLLNNSTLDDDEAETSDETQKIEIIPY